MLNLNGLLVYTRDKEAFYVPLPVELHRPIVGGCRCDYCLAHPEKVPAWDTLAIGIDVAHTWTVHMPDPAVSTKGR